VVWDDWRNGLPGEIYAARVTPAGQVLDTEGICLSPAPNGQWMADVAFDGANYFVVWADFRNGGNDNPDIYGARVTPSGVVLDTAGIPVSRAPDWQNEPRVAFDGTNYLVFWDDARPSRPGAYCARVTPAGAVLDTGGIYVANSFVGYGQPRKSLAFDGLDYCAVWTSPGGRDGMVAGAVISPSGIVLDTLVIAEGLFPSIALGAAGQKFVTWYCFTDVIEGKPYRTYRIWGQMNSFGGVAEKEPRGPGIDPTVSVLPNPAHSCFWVRSSQALSRLAVYDAAGRLTCSVNCGHLAQGKEWKVETQNMTAGVYFVEVRTETRASRFKLVVE
jgi:hypothetical protein